MGLSVATQLSAKGANLILVSRSLDKLEKALQIVKVRPPPAPPRSMHPNQTKPSQAAAKDPSKQRFHYISADVSKDSYAGPIVAEATKWNNGNPPDIVWCAAGMSRPELFLDMEMESMRRTMDINFFGTAEMAHAILKEWLAPDAPLNKQQPRHLIMTASVIVFFPMTGYASYSPSKAAMRALADTLSHEVQLYPQNVKVHLVLPGTIVSPGFARLMTTKPVITKLLEETDPQQTPGEVARQAIAGLESGQYLVTVNWLGSLMRWGALGGSLRNNWLVDTFMAAFIAVVVWPIVHFDMLGKTRGYGKKHGHPSTWKKQS
jgi:3-dehydrosphinganine reductase